MTDGWMISHLGGGELSSRGGDGKGKMRTWAAVCHLIAYIVVDTHAYTSSMHTRRHCQPTALRHYDVKSNQLLYPKPSV